ncbi:CHAP-domain-containing protein [Martensiomyces pterosporus]|nr:CHAP-domain-containing protein [Martensiomyces pterosporus]
MKFIAIATLALSAATQLASGYAITGADVVNCRSGPGTSNSVVKTYKGGENVSITCQTAGEAIRGDSLWDKTQDGCYVADYYVKTGTSNYVAANNPPPSGDNGNIPGPIKDDYPYPNECDGIDPWRYYKCQCTSFVAWRINSRLGVKFHNQYKGAAWGNANSWAGAARATGVPINNTPVPGAVAQTSGGSTLGHVAYVTKVSGDTVTVEEYNYVRHKYGVRTAPKNSFNYIHLKV